MRGKKHEFSEEEIKYIVENWGKESPYSMKKSLSVLGRLFAKLQKVKDW